MLHKYKKLGGGTKDNKNVLLSFVLNSFCHFFVTYNTAQ